MVGFKFKSRVAQYKNNSHYIIFIIELEYIYRVLSTDTDYECLSRLRCIVARHVCHGYDISLLTM